MEFRRAFKPVFGLGLALVALLSFGLLAAGPAQAASKGEEILKGLAKRYQGLDGLVADYSRRTQTPLSQEIFQNPGNVAATGQLAWRKPANLRLDQARPAKELLATDGNTAWWYLPEEKQVHVYRRLDLAGEMAPLLAFLTNLEELKKNFRVKLAPPDPDRANQAGLILVPRDKDSATGQIVAWSDGEFHLTGFDLLSVTGEKTSFFLTGVKAQALDYEEFAFKVPKGVKVVEETER
ncbi:MAG: outer membrane lipoprotein carrier protein LolA [Deltaproteobacteria bacterium]|jgi:outer membrane lipoprotein-sorting protein|nr:outer membrane lipoprotein carrier protein LolA [Deltaproteobacteria bacterium]